MMLTIIGSGDAFGSGGRLQTCFHVSSGDLSFLIDCGATSLIGMARQGLDPSRVDAIFISHLHGDHFAGLVWWMLHAQHVARREKSLIVVGPRGIEARYRTAAEVLFPGSTEMAMRFPLQFSEHVESALFEWRGLSCQVLEVCHPSGAPSYGMRFEFGGRSLSFSGDTEWVDALVDLSEGVDLHINECFVFDVELRYHMRWSLLREKLPLISAKRIVLTHMNEDMLAHAGEIDDPRIVISKDGLQLEI